MNILVDTHVLIWWLNDTKRLGRNASAMLSDPANALWMSAVSIWEISIKTALGLLDFQLTPERGVELLLEQGFRSLPIGFDHALAVRHLPLHHKDPFDRMLVAQAQCERLTLLSADPKIRAYDVPLLDASQ